MNVLGLIILVVVFIAFVTAIILLVRAYLDYLGQVYIDKEEEVIQFLIKQSQLRGNDDE